MTNGKDVNNDLLFSHLVHDAIISNAKFSKAKKLATQRLTILFRIRGEALQDGYPDALGNGLVNTRYILPRNVGVVTELPQPHSFAPKTSSWVSAVFLSKVARRSLAKAPK